MDHHIEELLAFYALGALTDEEKVLVDAYLSEHPEAREQIHDLEFAASALPFGISPVKPSDPTKKKLMARIAADQRGSALNRSSISRAQNRSGAVPQLAFSVLSLLITALAITSMYFLNRQLSLLQGEVAALKNALLAQADTVRQLNLALEQVNVRLPQSTPSTLTTFTIDGTSAQPNARAQLMTDPNSNSAVLVVSGLEPLPPGKTYQIWLIEGEARESAGLMNVDTVGQAVYILTSDQVIASFDALGVSIEPAEGSLQPTGDVVLRGEFY